MENAVRDGVASLETDYPGYDFTVIVLNMKFSRAIGMMEGVKRCAMTDLLFLVDVDIQFTVDVPDLIRSFTRLGEQVYFPIVFSMFKGEEDGYWRDFGYGIMAAYRQDIERVDGFNTTIVGWGKEDVDLYDRFVSTNMTIFRSPCPQRVQHDHRGLGQGGRGPLRQVRVDQHDHLQISVSSTGSTRPSWAGARRTWTSTTGS